ncbi:unnamed protein product [Didymodactylos carnosus]|uniref:CBS domain-containing protein n=1 Tax=Didymodactylos carnosus TaxID=1234261 RepID=A0A814AG52_9BILA|nr:unnamed protein product [Didymodactylos carnosus]CAF0940912.1 unnamed protein product [Didymodactylos carnosus]CAF3692684.1 unnamed protein product [Didymodactylos carnosus]CAF3716041.1 unnamed protein product [Didymodactylos carnosus]
MSDNYVVIDPTALSVSELTESIYSDEIYQSFFQTHTCYDVMPKSGKVLLLDAGLSIRKAFFALVYNNVRAALVWHAATSSTIGLLTISDFIALLIKFYDAKCVSKKSMETLETLSILQWREELQQGQSSTKIIHLSPDDSIYKAILTIINRKVHRIPIIDPVTKDYCCLITHKRILKFLYLYIYDLPQPTFIHKTLDELKIGLYDDLIMFESYAGH